MSKVCEDETKYLYDPPLALMIGVEKLFDWETIHNNSKHQGQGNILDFQDLELIKIQDTSLQELFAEIQKVVPLL